MQPGAVGNPSHSCMCNMFHEAEYVPFLHMYIYSELQLSVCLSVCQLVYVNILQFFVDGAIML